MAEDEKKYASGNPASAPALTGSAGPPSSAAGATGAAAGAIDATLPLGERALATGSAPSRGADTSTPCFANAELIGERYRIVRLIAEGGMGEVYEAEDLLLRERVALKSVRQDVARDEKVVERFKREIQLARRVTHANVCRIFDVGIHKRGNGKGELAFLTMELLDGETIAQRLAAKGRFTCEEALEIVKQVTAGLDAAHQVGVVHRDFKSSNVMLVSDGDGRLRAVITDFGLARGRAATADPSVTGDGGVVGSPAYMAPEQVEGREVTAAADIYSLGIVMYEMVTGRLPFVGDSPLSTAVMRLREAPITPCAHVAGLDGVWEAAILACLQRSPGERPKSARAVLERLVGPRPRRFLRWLVPLAAGLALAAGGLGWKSFGGSQMSMTPIDRPAAVPVAPDASGRRSVAVIGFKNLTNQADEGWICDALSEMISTELAASTDVRTIPSESVARAKRELGIMNREEISFAPDTLAKLRAILDTDYVLTGSYMAMGKAGGNKIRFDLKLQDTRTGDTVAVLSQTGNESDLVELVAASGVALRAKLALGDLTPSERESVRASMPNADVVKLYAEGLAQLRVEACSAARGPLEQAVAGDPNFPLAHAALAEALACLGYADRAKAEARRAVELSQRLPDHIRLAAQAKLFDITNQPEQAADIYKKLFERFPDNFDYGYKLAISQFRLLREGDLRQTMVALRRLPPPAGDSPRLDLIDAFSALIAGRGEEALRIAESAEKRAEDRGERLVAAGALVLQMRILDHLGRLDDALTAVTRARAVYEAAGDQDGVAQTLAGEASLREGKGDTVFAQKAEDQIAGIAGALHNPKELLYLRFMMAQRFAAQGNYDAAVRAYRDARELANAQGDDRLAGLMAMDVGFIELGRGNLAEAQKLVESALKREVGPELKTNLLVILADVAYTRGDTDGARRLLGDAEALVPKGASRTAIMLSRAQFACEEGDFKTGEQLSREALGAESALAPLANLSLAAALVEQKRWAEAEAALAKVEKSPFFEGPALRLSVVGVEAPAMAARDLPGARKRLEDGIAEAESLGLRAVVLELRFRRADVEKTHGDAAKGRALLAAVAADAQKAGLVNIARRAARHEQP